MQLPQLRRPTLQMNRLHQLVESFGTVLARTIAHRPRSAAALALLLVCSALPFAGQVRFDNTPDVFFLPNDPALAAYERFKAQFASDEYTLIQLQAPAQWTPAMIDDLRALRARLSSLPHVLKVHDIANARYVAATADGIDVGELVPRDTPAAALDERRKIALAHPYIGGRYISANGRYLAVVVESESIRGEIKYKQVLTDNFRTLLSEPRFAAYRPVLAGAPVLDADLGAIVTRENGKFGALSYLVVLVGLLCVFRSIAFSIVPLFVAAGSVVIAFGLMGALQLPMTLLTPIVPAFMVSVGIGSIVFLLSAAHTCWSEGASAAAATEAALRKVSAPSAAAVVTTAGALLAFSRSDIAPVRDVGLILGLSLPLTFVLSVLLTPVAFVFMRKRAAVATSSVLNLPVNTSRTQRYVALLDWVCEHRRAIALCTLLAAAMAAVGASQLRQDFHYLGTFKKDSELRRSYDVIDSNFHATSSMEIIVTATQDDYFRTPQALHRLERVQDALRSYHALPTRSYAMTDVVKETSQALHEGDAKAYTLPDSDAAASQYLLLFESSGRDDVAQLVSSDFRMARINVQLPNVPLSQMRMLVAYTEAALVEQFGDENVESHITGLVPLWMRINDYLAATQIESLLLSAAVVLTVMMLLSRSVVVGAAAASVNGLAVLLVLGVMGWLDIPLDPYLILVAGIAIGLLDDDTLHFIQHVRRELKSGHSVRDALRHTYVSAGLAMSYTAAVLIVAFSLYALSSLASLQKFGLLISLTVVIGIACELIVMPVVVLALGRLGFLKPVLHFQGTSDPHLDADMQSLRPARTP
jgi:predicted RND superfamily exporter protein